MSAAKPITFTAAMARAASDGSKTQTRRPILSAAKNMQREGMGVIKHRAAGDKWYGDHVWSVRNKMSVWGDYTHEEMLARAPYRVGDVLWVREPHAIELASEWARVTYRADGAREHIQVDDHSQLEQLQQQVTVQRGRWRAAMHMPRWAARTTLEVTALRPERLHEICEHDSFAEGVSGWVHDERCETARDGFRVLWDSIYAPRGRGFAWAANPWVWKIEFRRVLR